jgi:hypothetical protein
MCLQIIKPKANQFGDPQSSGKADVEHGPITSSGTSAWIRSVKQRLQFFVVEIVDEGIVGFLEGNRQDTSDLFNCRGDPILDEMRERLYGSETGVSRARGVATAGLKVFQKCKDQWRVQLLQSQSRGGRTIQLGSEAE